MSTGAVAGRLAAVTALWNAVRMAPVVSWLPPGQPTFSSVCPKLIHRVVHSLCAPIVVRGTDMGMFTLTAPAA